jgi:hypothetical protein
MTILLLFVAALVGGALNSVAGGGSFIALPALMSAGVAAGRRERDQHAGDVAGSRIERAGLSREVVTMRSWLTVSVSRAWSAGWRAAGC